MVSPDSVRFAVGVLGNIISLVLFLSPVPTFIAIRKKGSVLQYSPIPYLATFMNCMLWALYGLPIVKPNSTLLITINGAGIVIEVVYLSLFVIYSQDKKKRLMVVLIAIFEVIFIGIVAALVLCLSHTTQRRSQIVGLIAIFNTIIMYASPLSVMKLVITTKSVEYMPFFLSLASFVNAVTWSMYAVHPFDIYIAVPNGLGSLLGLAQLILYASYYKSTKEQIAARNAKAGQLGLSEVVVPPTHGSNNKLHSSEGSSGKVARVI